MNASDIIRTRQGQVVLVGLKNATGGNRICPINYTSYSQKLDVYNGLIGCGYINPVEMNIMSTPVVCSPINVSVDTMTTQASVSSTCANCSTTSFFVTTSTPNVCPPIQCTMPDAYIQCNSSIVCCSISNIYNRGLNMISTPLICNPITISMDTYIQPSVVSTGCDMCSTVIYYNSMVSTVQVCPPVQYMPPESYINAPTGIDVTPICEYNYPYTVSLSTIEVCPPLDVSVTTNNQIQGGFCSSLCISE